MQIPSLSPKGPESAAFLGNANGRMSIIKDTSFIYSKALIETFLCARGCANPCRYSHNKTYPQVPRGLSSSRSEASTKLERGFYRRMYKGTSLKLRKKKSSWKM